LRETFLGITFFTLTHPCFLSFLFSETEELELSLLFLTTGVGLNDIRKTALITGTPTTFLLIGDGDDGGAQTMRRPDNV